MAKHTHEDLFEGTKMTFGEHLEELRVVFIRALVGLTIGVLIGMMVAEDVVNFIEGPLVEALEKHSSETALIKLHELYGKDVPADVLALARDAGFIYEELYLDRNEMARIAGMDLARDAESAGTQPLTSSLDQELPIPSGGFVKTRVWRTAKARITVLSPSEAFMVWMKAGFVTGLLIASPYIFYQIWVFIAAGLYPHEQRYVYVFLPFSIALFLGGAALAFFFVFGPVLDFLFSFARSMNITPDLRISEVISFILILPLGFGIAFQLPLVMLLVNRIGLVTVETYLEKWRIAILAIFVISMVLTPADPVSMLFMAVPLTGLYFLGVALCKWMPRGRNPFDEAYEP